MHNANRSPAPGSLTRKATEYLESKLKEGYKLTVEYDPEAGMVLVEFLRSEPFGQATIGSDTFADAMNQLADPDYYSEFSETVDRALDAMYARREAQSPRQAADTMRLVFEAKCPFTDSNHNPAHCRLSLYKQDEGAAPQAVVIATETADNPGMSVTNTYETLANFATAVFDLHPERTLWVEHYSAESYTGKPLEHENGDRYSLVHMHWDGKRFSTPRFAYLSKSQLQGLLGRPLDQEPRPEFGPKTLTLEQVNAVAARFKLQVVSAQDERFQHDPTSQQTGKEYVVIDDQGEVLSPCKDLNSASLFLTLWSYGHAPVKTDVEQAAEAIALEKLNAIAERNTNQT